MARDRTAPARGPARLARWGRLQVDARTTAANRWITDHRDGNVLVDLGCRIDERDRLAAGGVTGSAVAFRLFLFFVPFLLFLVGVLGFVAAFLDSGTVLKATGVTGKLAEQIQAAFTQPTSTRWLATGFGLVGMVTSGRALAKVLIIASALAWQVPVQRRKAAKVVAIVLGTTVSVALVSALVNRVRESAGLAVAWLSFLPVVLVYIVAWSLLLLVLPRGTSDLSAVLPGAVLFSITLAGMEAVTQLYLPGRFDHASALYGSIGVTVVTLGWFFFLGRVLVLAMTLNAAVYERIGSVSIFVFGLPVLRALPRRWPRFAQLIGLNNFESAHRGGPDRDPSVSKGVVDMASSERSARERYAAHNVVALYRTLDEARGAVAALNQAGVDSPHIELLDSQSPMAPLGGSAQRELDQVAVTRRVGRRAAIGAVIGAVVGVLVGLLIHLIVDAGNVVPEIVGLLAGLLVGAALGAFYGGASGLPREGTFSDLRARRNGVAVHADEAELVERAVATLTPTSPELLARFGSDGHLQRVNT